MNLYNEDEAGISNKSESKQKNNKKTADQVISVLKGPRKKRSKKRPALVFLVFLFVILTVTVYFALDVYNDFTGKGLSSEEIIIVVKEGETPKQISYTLQQNGLIKYPNIFIFYLKQIKADTKIKKGTFKIKANAGYKAIAQRITAMPDDSKEVIRITIPEGLTLKDTLKLLSQKTNINEQEFITALENFDFSVSYYKNITRTQNKYEGYLYPDTYEVYANENAASILKRMFDNFDKKIKDNDIVNKANSMGMTLDEAINLASIIEKEASKEADRKMASGVFHNRLDINMKLQSCVTVLYALGVHKDIVTTEDTKIESPYNTYYITGLPLGPICNPGIQSILAAVEPTPNDYYYFLSKKDGTMLYAKTYEEHQRNKASDN